MKKALLAVLAVAWAVLALGCVSDGGKSATEEEFQRLYKEYSVRFHEKMVGTAETMKPVQITAEAARIWDETFAGKEKGLKVREIIIFHELRPRIFPFDGPESGGRGEHGFHLMLGYDAPEYTGIGCAYRFALK